MTRAVTVFVASGVIFAIGLGLAGGLDRTGATILAFVLATGGLSIAVARRARSGAVEPARCENCGGLTSPNAPYCKHCGAQAELSN